MARKIKVVKEREGKETVFAVMDGKQEIAWGYSAEAAMQEALETILAERDLLKNKLEISEHFKTALKRLMS